VEEAIEAEDEKHEPQEEPRDENECFHDVDGCKKALFAAVGFRAVDARDCDEADENKGEGDHGNGGLRGVGLIRW
jgi:hypothetical protein